MDWSGIHIKLLLRVSSYKRVGLSSVFTYLVGALVEIRLCLTLYIVTLQSIV